MTDKLDQARETFRRELPVEARPAAREAAIANAMATFADYSRKPQGSGALMRLKRWMGGITSGRTTMHSLKLNHYLMAGSSLAVLTFAAATSAALADDLCMKIETAALEGKNAEIDALIAQIEKADVGPGAEDAGTVQFTWLNKDGKEQSKLFTQPRRADCLKLLDALADLAGKHGTRK